MSVREFADWRGRKYAKNSIPRHVRTNAQNGSEKKRGKNNDAGP
jgi:hypothetical protein